MTTAAAAVVLLPSLPDTPEEAAITHLFQTVPESWRVVVDEWRRHEMLCECGKHFREFYNLGQWKCRQHAMPRGDGQHEWPCCGAQSPNAPGCIRADHRKKGYPPYGYPDTQYIPDEVFARMQVVLRDAILGAERRGTSTAPEYMVGILRFDDLQRESRVDSSSSSAGN